VSDVESAGRTDNKTTLIAVADAASARLFFRRRPGSPLEELVLPALAADAIAEKKAPVETCDDEQILYGTPAHAFLQAVAASVGQAARQSHARRVVLCAAPHALCALRDGLNCATRHLLAGELTRNVVHEPVAGIDAWLSQLHI
jgi:protein required for attachment to host cells